MSSDHTGVDYRSYDYPWTHKTWRVDRGMVPRVVVLDQNFNPVATTIHHQDWSSKNPEADAALIELAPEMAEAILAWEDEQSIYGTGTDRLDEMLFAVAERLRMIIKEHTT